MSDPLTEIVKLLQPSADFSKVVEASGAWRVRRAERGRPFLCVMLAGRSRLEIGDRAPIHLEAGDFVLIPEAQDFAMSAADITASDVKETRPTAQRDGSFRLGPPEAPASARLIVVYFSFGSPDASLLLSLLPRVIVVRDEPRLVTLVQQISDETRAQRPGREVIVARLLDVMFIEALRTTSREHSLPGLLPAMDDSQLAVAIRRIYRHPGHDWTVEKLAREAGMSRTAFFERFRKVVGATPMDHLVAWRMAIAKNLLNQNLRVHEVASRVGYGSTSSFSTAFRRHVGVSPVQFADAQH